MQVGAGLDGRLGLTFDQLIEAGTEAKRLGFESLWTPAGGVPDAFHICAAWGRATKLATGTSVVPAARMWHPDALGTQAATVAQLTGTPFVLGMGTGGIGPGAWAAAEMPDRPVAAMRRYLAELRATADRAGFQLGLAALGPQMVRLAGELADVVLPNWSSPATTAWCRDELAAGAARTDRDPAEVRIAMYIRVCVDDDVAAARQTLGAQVVNYAMIPGYRAHFTRMGFDDEIGELEARQRSGAGLAELVDAASDELLLAVGYYGPAAGAAEAYRALSVGLDETIVRVLTPAPSLVKVVATLEALRPSAVKS
jgi:alkanesulfonate monooxygenase SsuD/methylene tetrahydromethanopterin reductase-like flavin-dependent oxidoreductase (luciferase family)